MKILAIDPGNTESAYVLMDEDYKPLEFGKLKNSDMRQYLKSAMRYEEFKDDYYTRVALEMIASYGMAVGSTVFDTCVWIGRYTEIADRGGEHDYNYVYRKDVKMNLCGQTKAKDANIRQALIDRFGVVGTKRSPGFFYGFKSDVWSAYAVGVTYLDQFKGVQCGN